MTEINIDLPSTTLPDARRRVRFSDVDVLATYYDEVLAVHHDDPIPHPSFPTAQKTWKVRERRSQASLETNFRGRYLSIQPGDELVFENRAKDSEKESSDVIRLVNITSSHVAFKVKTTAPEKFRVKPSFGFIESGGSKTVEVSVMPGLVMTAQKDRFLVMSVPLDKEPQSHNELVDYWQELLKDGTFGSIIDEHKLRCTVSTTAIIEDRSRKVDVELQDGKAPLSVFDRLETIESKLDALLLKQKQKSVSNAKMRWNLLTVALALVFLLLCMRIFTFISGTIL